MRPQLLGAGVLVMVMGGGLYAIGVPIVDVWSIPLAVGGAVMAAASFFLPESRGPVEPPEGYRFCAYCSTPVKVGAERCDHCNGIQPKGVA